MLSNKRFFVFSGIVVATTMFLLIALSIYMTSRAHSKPTEDPIFGVTPALQGSQGGTGTTTTIVGNVGNCLKVASVSPLIWDIGSCGSGSGGGGFPFDTTAYGVSTTTIVGFTAGSMSLASTTIGNGTLTGGLTISGSATSTGSNFHILSSRCPTTNADVAGTGLEVCGSDNTAGGVNIILGNRNSGTSAFSDLFMQNDASVGSSTLYGVLDLNSSTFTNTVFGPLASIPNGLLLQNTIGPLTLGASTNTPASSYVNFFTGGVQNLNERMRIDSNGLVGIGTTTPGALLAVSNSATTPAKTALFQIASTTGGVSTTTLFNISNTGALTQVGGVSLSNGLLTINSGVADNAVHGNFFYTPSTGTQYEMNSNGSNFGTIQSEAAAGSASIWSLSYRSTISPTRGAIPVLTWNDAQNVGIGTTTPVARFSISLNSGTTMPSNNAFIIASSTAAATTTLFKIDNIGQLNLITVNGTSTFADRYGSPLFSVNSASTTGSIFTVAATTSSPSNLIKLFDVDQYGHLTASSTRATPTVSCSPSGGTITATSNDVTGDVTGGTLSTACTVTFATPYTVTPEVFVTPNSATQMVAVTSRSTTSFTISFAAAITNDNVSYFVIQP